MRNALHSHLRLRAPANGVRWTRTVTRGTGLLVCALLASCGAPHPHTFAGEPITRPLRIATLPLANYATTRNAVDHVMPLLINGLGRIRGVEVIDPGKVEEALAQEPWLLMDRVPPDLVDRIGTALGADAVLVGSLLQFGYRESSDEQTPQVSLSLRLLEVPGERVLWTAVHSRDGADSEWIFGLGRIEGVDRLASDTVDEILKGFPVRYSGAWPVPAAPDSMGAPAGKGD